MAASIDQKLDTFKHNPALLKSLASLQRGIEKESLRVTPKGTLAQTPHSDALGSALCHPSITTDYSEALLEFITPVNPLISSTLQNLEDIHAYVYLQIQHQDEMLWSLSMPCQLGTAEDIPVAQYGSSNVAKMKTIYRLGLGHRYGRAMQTISGIHYNFSLTDRFWSEYQRLQKDEQALNQFKTQEYLGLIRNFRRFVPLYVYLFGASPALCKSFLRDQSHDLEAFDDHTFFKPYATALRMGDLGYQSSAQDSLFVCYNNLDDYISSLRKAITNPIEAYEKIGLKDKAGDYQQLNTSLLQIENEFYSPIRPKRVAASGEAPINALARSGIDYIEVRCVDVNPFAPVGIDADTIRFLDIFLLYCLLLESPVLNHEECPQTVANLRKVVNEGRNPALTLTIDNQETRFTDWARELLEKMRPLAETLDSLHAVDHYQRVLEEQLMKVADPDQTPSAQVLSIMKSEGITFAEFGRRQSKKWQMHFLDLGLSKDKSDAYNVLAADSLAQQKTLEAADNQSFEAYLQNFYQQYFVE